jgi:hypothetical protein
VTLPSVALLITPQNKRIHFPPIHRCGRYTPPLLPPTNNSTTLCLRASWDLHLAYAVMQHVLHSIHVSVVDYPSSCGARAISSIYFNDVVFDALRDWRRSCLALDTATIYVVSASKCYHVRTAL